jgi:hypothetical protein
MENQSYQFKSQGQLNEEVSADCVDLTTEQELAIIDAIADADFAKEYGIEVKDIQAFIAKMQREA